MKIKGLTFHVNCPICQTLFSLKKKSKKILKQSSDAVKNSLTICKQWGPWSDASLSLSLWTSLVMDTWVHLTCMHFFLQICKLPTDINNQPKVLTTAHTIYIPSKLFWAVVTSDCTTARSYTYMHCCVSEGGKILLLLVSNDQLYDCFVFSRKY